ncbi:MAG: hypothetical protein B6D55_07205 [Candidatus Omnitrophica bacterium 4484_70.2]|nr:MAG: hypothetical protein B6D55_07205 [Candidatus Omnitrophica bacterium 4484_70.2]
MGKITQALRKIQEEKEKKSKIQKTIEDSNVVKDNFVKKEKEEEDFPFSRGKEYSLKNKAFLVSKKDISGIDSRIITYYDPSSPLSEQYRILRTNLKSILRKIKATRRNIKSSNFASVFTISSSLHNEGKTITAVNLAMSLASETETRVLLIDGDLRNGLIHKLLNIEAEPGLSTILINDYEWTVGLHPTRKENLFVIPRGKISPISSELLSSRKMHIILEKLREENFNYIIIDTPPLLSFADAQLVTQFTDGIIIVVEANHTKAEVVKKAKELCEQANNKILGFILTKVDYYAPDFYYYYYNYKNYKKDV